MRRRRNRFSVRGVFAGVLVGSVAAAAHLPLGCGTQDETHGPAASSSSATGAGGEGGSVTVTPTVLLPKSSLDPSELGVLVNDQDPQSVAVASHYQTARAIPDEQVFTLSFAPPGDVMDPQDFAALEAQLAAMVPDSIQAYAITWTTPYRVGCMSVTAAFALGFGTQYCNTTGMGCGPTAPVPYYDSSSFAPYTDHAIRPTMAIVGATTADATALIDRGVAADDTFPTGDGYMVRTTDQARSVRWPDFVATLNAWSHPEGLTLSFVDNSSGSGSNTIDNTQNILFYFTGLANVTGIDTNTYRPGAIADHLTSFGGQVPQSGQMSIARWLEAGATGSYGTVVEPCNYPTKFPNTQRLLPHYFRGETLIEAYWKSVRWPGEGMFAGEPLARPWGTQSVDVTDGVITIVTTILEPTRLYQVVSGPTANGPWDTVALGGISIPNHRLATIVVDPATEPFYLLRLE